MSYMFLLWSIGWWSVIGYMCYIIIDNIVNDKIPA